MRAGAVEVHVVCEEEVGAPLQNGNTMWDGHDALARMTVAPEASRNPRVSTSGGDGEDEKDSTRRSTARTRPRPSASAGKEVPGALQHGARRSCSG